MCKHFVDLVRIPAILRATSEVVGAPVEFWRVDSQLRVQLGILSGQNLNLCIQSANLLSNRESQRAHLELHAQLAELRTQSPKLRADFRSCGHKMVIRSQSFQVGRTLGQLDEFFGNELRNLRDCASDSWNWHATSQIVLVICALDAQFVKLRVNFQTCPLKKSFRLQKSRFCQ